MAERALDVYRRPLEYLLRAEETFSTEATVVRRDVELAVSFDQLMDHEDSLPILVLTPSKKNPSHSSSVDLNQPGVRKLSPSESAILSSQIIEVVSWHFLWSINKGLSASSRPPDEALSKVLVDLASIPQRQMVEAREVCKKHFSATGKLRILGAAPVDFDLSILLHSLCAQLAERRFEFLVVERPNSNARQAPVRYSYSRSFDDRHTSWRGAVRRSLSGVPFDYVLHAPLARICETYQATSAAPSGYFFDQQKPVCDPRDVISADIKDPGSLSNVRSWLDRVERQALNSDVDATLMSNDIAVSVLELDKAWKSENRVYLYFKIYEKPPGSLLLPGCTITVLCLFLTCLMVWVARDASTIPDSIGAVLTGVSFTLSSFGTLFARDAVRAVVPKILHGLSAPLVVLFVIWLFTHPNRPYNEPSRHFWRWAIELAPGAAILLVLLSSLIYLAVRSRCAYKRLRQLRNRPIQHGDRE